MAMSKNGVCFEKVGKRPLEIGVLCVAFEILKMGVLVKMFQDLHGRESSPRQCVALGL